jgi:citronellol/citronellal dehydrogenase
MRTPAARVAVVTGGGTGIGRATALQLARDGYHVAICGRRPTPLEAVREEIAIAGGVCLAQPCDIREPDQVSSFIDRVLAEAERVDVLVNNAGGQYPSPAEAITLNGFRAVHRLTLEATWSVTREVATRAFIPQLSGNVVFIGFSPRGGMPEMMHAAAARSALESMASSLAIEWAKYDIRSNCVNVGTIATEGLEQYDQSDVKQWIETIPMRRLGSPDEVANVIAFVVSSAASYITGSTITVDGGAGAWGIGGNPPDHVQP